MADILIAAIIFGIALGLIISGKVHRTIVAVVGAVVMVLVGKYFGFYTEEEALKAIDFNTIGLLFGMMVIVSILKGTGFFQYLAIKAAKLSRGRPWRLIIFLGLITSFISMIIDNVTTVLLMAPVTILITDILGINPLPILLMETLLSNVGGMGTLVGDPPNLMIGSAAGLSFNSFLTHLLPIALLGLMISLLLARFIFRKLIFQQGSSMSKIMIMKEKESIKDRKTLKVCLAVLIGMVILFSLESFLKLKVAFISLAGAALILSLIRPNVEEVLRLVEWPVLIFFIGLFVMVGGLNNSGVLEIIGLRIGSFAQRNLLLGTLVLTWVTILLCAVVDRIPFTAAMIPVINHISSMGVNVTPLWWGLALGAGFGGNGTPIGSSAGVVTMSLSEKTNSPITFRNWFTSGSLITIASCLVGTMVMVIFFKWYT